MYDIPFKFASTALVAAVSGGASVISEHTLIPLGIFVAATLVICGAAWKVAVAVTKATDRLERMEERISQLEQKLKELT